MEDGFEQVVRVNSNERTGDESGDEWTVFYALYRVHTEEGVVVYDLYDDDGFGNGTMICRGTHRSRMVSLTMRLGTFVEWTKPAQVA